MPVSGIGGGSIPSGAADPNAQVKGEVQKLLKELQEYLKKLASGQPVGDTFVDMMRKWGYDKGSNGILQRLEKAFPPGSPGAELVYKASTLFGQMVATFGDSGPKSYPFQDSANAFIQVMKGLANML